jgi:hypothetical protein
MGKETKSRKQGRSCLYAILIGSLLVCAVGAASALGVCPPEGPWPQPPWCTSKVDCVDYPPTIVDDIIRRVSDSIGAQNLKVANGCMFMRSIGDNPFQPFEYRELGYLPGTESYAPVDRPITFGVSIADFWGNPYIIPTGLEENIPKLARELWYDTVTLGADPRKHANLENTARRSAQLGAKVFMAEDFIMLVDDDLTLRRFDYPATESMTQDELTRIAEAAHQNGMEAMLQLTILDTAFYDKVADYFNSGQPGSLYDVMDAVQRYDSRNTGEDTATLHEHWRAAILEETRMAETAGFDRLMVTPQTMGWTNKGETVALDDAEWKKTIAAVRQIFFGKLGGGTVYLNEAYDSGYTYFQDLDFFMIDIPITRITAGYAADDLDGMTAAWKEYLLSPSVMQFSGVPELWHGLLVNSYDGVLERGWIESGGHYPDLNRDDRVQSVVYEAFLRALYESPETPVNGVITWGYAWTDYIYPNDHEIRSDLSNSIRGKDAENVFSRWTTIFK